MPSRRLGSSLGVDLVPFKVCSHDCLYCQLGPTTKLTAERFLPVTVEELVIQVRRRLSEGVHPDWVTIAGSGEPTLYRDMGLLIAALKAEVGVPVALITNGSLFFDPDVRRSAALADLVLPSLDAWDEASFVRINRPANGLTLSAMVDGLSRFRDEFNGKIWLEMMILAGINDGPDAVSGLARQARRIRPDRIQLNTPVRPPAYPEARVLPRKALEAMCASFDPVAEVIADFSKASASVSHDLDGLAEAILTTVSRRPCTLEDLSAGLEAIPNEVLKAIEILRVADRIKSEGAYWMPVSK